MIDLDAFNTDLFNGTFDEEVLFTPSGGQARPVRAIFDNPYQGTQYAQGDIEIESSGPKATCRDTEVAGVAHGDTLQIRGKTWYVLEVQPDGTGLVVLILSEDPI